MTTELIAELQYNTELVVADATTYQLRATRYGLPDSVYIKVANKQLLELQRCGTVAA